MLATTVVLAAASILAAGAETVRGSYFGRSNYVEYLPGNLPLIISVPHGGMLTPEEIPNRVRTPANKDFVTSTDSGTRELALSIREAFKSRLGGRPHVIICHLKRTKVDCNRAIEDGAGGQVLAAQAWSEFHGFITAASNIVVTTSGRGFYIDLHGHSHPVKRLELGYMLRGYQLTNSDAALIEGSFANQSSLRSLARQMPGSFPEMLRGSRSLGSLMSAWRKT